MLRFLTDKLRAHSLEEELDFQKESEYRDSGTESDDESENTNSAFQPEERNKMEKQNDVGWELGSHHYIFPTQFINHGTRVEHISDEISTKRDSSYSGSNSPLFESFNYTDSALPSDSDHAYDHHSSSEEELETIHKSFHEIDQLTSEFPSCLCETQTFEERGGGTGASSKIAPENKRKWSQVALNRLSMESSSSSDEEVQGLLRPLSDPVKFCTSPPIDAHKPSRSHHSPPPKLFLFSSPGGGGGAGVGIGRGAVAIHSGGVFKVLRPCDLNVNEHKCISHLGGGEIRSHPPTPTDPSNNLNLTTLGGGDGGGTGNTARESSSRHKRHRHHNPRHIQRPWLDFEKMQQLKTRSLTTWKSGELSLSCS